MISEEVKIMKTEQSRKNEKLFYFNFYLNDWLIFHNESFNIKITTMTLC